MLDVFNPEAEHPFGVLAPLLECAGQQLEGEEWTVTLCFVFIVSKCKSQLTTLAMIRKT